MTDYIYNGYREDQDLEFLARVKNEDLNDLVVIITKKLSEELTINELYKKHSPNHSKYWKVIAGELQKFGGNTIANLFRGEKGVYYREILKDISKKYKIIWNETETTSDIERKIIAKIMTKAIENMNNEEKEKFSKLLKDQNFGKNILDFKGEALTSALIVLLKSKGFLAYKSLLIITNSLFKLLFGRGLTLAANAGLTKTLGIVLGPVGWGLTSLWFVYDIAGPSYKVTVPSVMIIHMLRMKYNQENQE